MIEKSNNENNDQYIVDNLTIIIPKIVVGLIFTEDDMKQRQIEMEEEENPYSYDK